MKRTIFAGFVLFVALGLTSMAALAVERIPLLVLTAVVTGGTVIAADLATTRLRRRMRQELSSGTERDAATRQHASAAGPEVEEMLDPKQDTPAEEEPMELWFIPRTIEPETSHSWLPAGRDEAPASSAEEPRTRMATVSQFIGRKIGPYLIQAKIGQGGMATVYRGQHQELNRPVAIKILEPSLVGTAEMADAFRREAQTIANLRHPNIVQVYDFGSVDNTHYLAMEFVDGVDLGAQIARRREGGLPFCHEEMLDLLRQVADALDYAHRQGIVHRDVKPGNVLLRANPLKGTGSQPILSDFGLAALRRTRATLITTIGRNVLGTPEYTAPEQALDTQAASPQSDIYSLGCVLYEMVTGHLPFEAESPLSIALMHINEDPVPPRRHVPDLASEAEVVILRALAKEPEQRFATATAMIEALAEAWSSEGGTKTPTGPILESDADRNASRREGASTHGQS